MNSAVTAIARRVLAVAALAVSGTALAGSLPPEKWVLRDVEGNLLSGLTDGRLETASTLEFSELSGGLSVTIDLQSVHQLHRVYWCGNAECKGQGTPCLKPRNSSQPISIVVFVGATPQTCRRVGDLTWLDDLKRKAPDPMLDPAGAKEPPINVEGDVRFPVTAGRYVRLQVQGVPKNSSWILGEIEIYGFAAAAANRNAVVLPANAPAPLVLAARDLSYYLGELAGEPHPIITPAQTNDYPGILYRIEDLSPLAPDYATMVRNMQDGKLPVRLAPPLPAFDIYPLPAPQVNVERQGREVVFRAWPYRNVLVSVWKFLEGQGVRWVYPDPQGESVPRGKGVNLDILPLRYAPSADWIYGFDVIEFLTMHAYVQHPLSEGSLCFMRNGACCMHAGCLQPVGGEEVPRATPRKPEVQDDYKEGFEGFPHNFETVLPRRILTAHPEWMGLARGDKFGKENAGKRCIGPSPCLTNPELIQFVTDKMLAWAALSPGVPLRFNLLPMDCAVYCECDRCLALNQPLVPPWGLAWCAPGAYYGSDLYYYFVCEVAERVQKQAPTVTIGALAYAEVVVPPKKIEKFPSNVVVQVCQYGDPSLPMDAPPNAAMKQCMEQWAHKCSRLEEYSYVLLNENSAAWPMPLPMVGAMVDRAKYLHQLGALRGHTQTSMGALPYNPWNFYAFPRICWNTEQSADDILQEFFSRFFCESGGAMLAYYKAAEEFHRAKSSGFHGTYGYGYGLGLGQYPYPVLQAMAGHLAAAEKAAKHWVTRRRLATMRAGFAWLLQARGLTLEDLASVERLPTAGPGRPPVKVTPETIQVPPGRRGDRVLYGNRRMGHNIHFEKAGEYLVTVRATGSERQQRGVAKRDLSVYAGAEAVGSVDVPDGARQYVIPIQAPEGVHELDLMVTWNGGPVEIHEITIECQPGKGRKAE